MPSAFSELIAAQFDPLYRTALRLTGNVSDAEDLVQETCLRAHRAWAQLRERAGARAWLFQILRTTWIDLLRKAARRPVLLAMEHEPEQPLADAAPVPNITAAADRQALEQGFDEEVLAAMNDLAEEERLALMFQTFGGLSYREISEALECPLGTVMSRLHRAKAALRTRLAEYAMREGIIPRSHSSEEGRSNA